MAGLRDVAVVSFASWSTPQAVGVNEVEYLMPVVNDAVERSGIGKKDIGFTVSGSCDYLAGVPFAFVEGLNAVGAWPPIRESHVEMDGAWALYEAWVRLQHGDVDSALVYAFGKPSLGDLAETLAIQFDPYFTAPLWPDAVSVAALQARAYDERYEMKCAPTHDGAAAVVLAVGDLARQVCERPSWITGIDHRIDPQELGLRDLTQAPSARLAAEKAGVAGAPIDVAELHASYSHQELILREALGLNSETTINPSGGAFAGDVMMATGLMRIGEAANRIIDGTAQRAVGHATSGPCLQQNLVCVMSGEPNR